jgi:3-oxoacyl-[acyl-carrier protein] reductase
LKVAQEAIAGATGAKVEAVVADLAKPGGEEAAVEHAVSCWERVDILVTNIGGPPAGKFGELTAEMWMSAYHLTLESVLNLVRLVLPGMKERRWGRILNITSIVVKQPVESLMLSNAMRAGVTGFARSLANEVAPFGVTVNNVLPGYTRTERLQELAASGSESGGRTAEAVFDAWEAEIPMGRLGEPRELAALAAFLVSERASYITGASITCDGGWVKGLY